MAAGKQGSRRLIVNADDFGRSREINQAVIRAHREGILTTASLMVAGDAFDEAVELARQNPRLGVGLHLTLVCGRSVLPARAIPGLVNNAQLFRDDAVAAGMVYFANRNLAGQIEGEITAQFERFHKSGLVLDHVNGHLNMHLHPVVFGCLARNARRFRITAMRVTMDPFFLNARLASGRWLYRTSHAFIFMALSRTAMPRLRRLGIRFTDRVFGLLQNALVDERFVLDLLPRLPEGNSELYSHPSLNEFKHELDALISPDVGRRIDEERVELIRYQDL